MHKKNNLCEIEKVLKKQKIIAMLAPSYIANFDYPQIIPMLRDLGCDKVVEVTFGAKMINRGYHKKLKNSKKLLIASVCPGITELIKEKYPRLKNNLIKVDSPMIAMGKIVRKTYPKHKILFISPCHYKKAEAEPSDYIDYIIDYSQLQALFKKYKIKKPNHSKSMFNKFYNDYTKIYPLAGGLSKTAHLKGVIRKEQTKQIDGVKEVTKYLNNPDKNIRFLDVTFCKGGCIGGPCIISNLTLAQRKKRVLNYLKQSKSEDIPETRKGLIEKAEGIRFSS